jgi:hypothetical protein
MTDRQMKAIGVLACAAVVGVIAQRTVRAEASVLGLSTFELALVGIAASAFVTRQA